MEGDAAGCSRKDPPCHANADKSFSSEQQPGTSGALTPIKNWAEQFAHIADTCDLNDCAKSWMLSRIHLWNSLDALDSCEDLSRNQSRILEGSLREVFLEFITEREAFLRFLISRNINVEHESQSHLFYHFIRGPETLSSYIMSKNLDVHFSVDDCVKIRRELSNIGPASYDNNVNANVLQEIEAFLKSQKVSAVAVEEVIQNVTKFDELSTALENCEELTKREVKQLTETLKDLFTKFKIAKYNQHPQLKTIASYLESLSVPVEAVEWILNWLSSQETPSLNLDHLDQCEDLSKRQCKAIKEKLREVYKIDDVQLIEAKPACEIFLEKVDVVLKNRPDISDASRTWIFENICLFQSLDDLELSEDLSRRQIYYLQSSLKKDFNQLRSIEPTLLPGTQEASVSNIQVESNSASAEMSGGSKGVVASNCGDHLEAFTIVDLILMNSLEHTKVNKLHLPKNALETIIEVLSERYQNGVLSFSKSLSSDFNIQFEELNGAYVKTVALFGPNEAIMQALETVNSTGIVKAIKKELQEKPTGLYLIDIMPIKHKFIVCRSSEPNFDCILSRSVLFLLKFMHQLTQNVVFCLIPKHDSTLAVEKKQLSTSNRRACCALEKHELQHESFKIKPLIIIIGEKTDLESKWNLYSTASGLLGTVCREVVGSSKPKFEGQPANVYELEQILRGTEIADLSCICHQFKIRYLETFDPETYESLEKEAEKHMSQLQTLTDEAVREIVLFSTAMHFIKSEIHYAFAVVKSFYINNPHTTNNLWNERAGFYHWSIDKVLSLRDAQLVRESCRVSREPRHCIGKYMLWIALSQLEGKPAILEEKGFYDVTWLELDNLIRNCQIWKNAFGQPIVQNVMRIIASSIDYTRVDELLEYSVKTFVQYIISIIEPHTDTTLFRTFCRQHQRKGKDKHKERELTRLAVQKFDELMKTRQTEFDSHSGTQKWLKNITFAKKKGEKEFCFLKVTIEQKATKNMIQIYQLTPSKDKQERMTLGDCDLDVSKLEWLKVGELDTMTHIVAHAIYSLDSSKVLVIFNEETRSKTNVYNFTDMSKAIMSMPLGKVVSESSFDSKTRVLAIHSCMEFGVIHFLRFGEDGFSANKLKELDLVNVFEVEGSNFPFCMQPNSSYLWFFCESRLRKMDYKKSTLVKTANLDTEDTYLSLKCTPDGGCLLVITRNGQCFPVMTETGSILEVIDEISAELHLTAICNQMISFDRIDEQTFKINKMEVTGAQHEMKLSKTEVNKNSGTGRKDVKPNSHWINYLYWMYTKFPCKDLLLTRNQGMDFWILDLAKNETLRRKLMSGVSSLFSKLQLTHKPTENLSIHTEKILQSLTEVPLVKTTDTPIKMGEFLKQLITFVPIQIARCQANAFYILENGQPMSLDSVNTAFDLTDKISLGFYETILNAWNGDIKVISSMGKQSTGKSYTLNHLTGSSFNIAGTRCTDGCWMTVKEQDDCLYVVLDFEGLGSIERTEQEDMLLSLFNSAVSTITIFKTEKRLDREVEKLFNKMNLGSDQLKGNGQVFRGKFVIIINDVAEQDVDDTPKEFEEKINSIVTKSDNNFIKKLYDSNFEIQAFPAFESSDYYENIACLLYTIKEEMTPVFQSGPQFAGFLKLLMAKLAVNDFSPLDRQQIDERVRFLKAHLDYAIHFGQISDEDPKRRELDLKSLDNPTINVPNTKNINLNSVGVVELNDFEIIFSENQLDDFLMHFSSKILDITSDNFLAWRGALVNHLEETIKFRFERVKLWLKINLKKWGTIGNQEYNDIINNIMERLETKEFSFQQKFKFCDEKCECCFLKCTQIASHKEAHGCSSPHKCTGNCFYCDSSEQKNKCKMPFGHNGKHLCAEISHLCGKPCRYQELNGCEAECQKLNGHGDEHQCSEKHHPCADTCSLPSCSGRCIINCEEEHIVHKCSREQCMSKCSIDSCPNKCAALDHFHGLDLSKIFKMEQKISDELPFVDSVGTRFDCDEHFCGKEHHCEDSCMKEGFCQVWTEKLLKDEVFTGARDKFTYSLQFAEKGQKLTCRQKIRPFEKTHEGPHVCPNEMHFCMTICPTCENICDKPVNHVSTGDVLHHVRHGNMRNCFFAANEDDIQVGSHKYKVGEPAVAEMCHVFCKTLGRGHAHIVECNNLTGHCYYTIREDGRRHQTTNYEPHPEIPKDEMTHEAYWAMIGFQDPCQEIDVEEFQKCPAVCPSESHVEDQEEVFCELPVLHNPIKTPADARRSRGFVTKDGHLFPCNHPIRFYHFILCLDDSGSMHGPPWWSLVRAVQKFVRQRLQTSERDAISIVIHSDRPRVVAEFMAMSEFTKGLLKYKGGGNDFSAALQVADDLIGNHLGRNVNPVLIFMSDGNCRNGEIEMQEICNKYKWDHRLQIYTLGFGRIRFHKLRELARVGRGEFVEAVNGMQLNAAFVDISAKHPATIGVVL